MSDSVQINLVCCTEVILRDLAAQEVTKRHVSLTYAMALKSWAQKADNPDWARINTAIRERWGTKGLEAVKKRAWAIAEGRIQP